MKWGIVVAKDKLDIINIMKFTLKVTKKYFEWTVRKLQVKNVNKIF